MTVLSLEGLTAHSGGRTLLAGVDLAIAAGERLALVGFSGSGKSLAARAMLALPPPGVRYGGRVVFDGDDLLAAPDRAVRRVRGAQIAIVFQEPATALNPAMRIGAQIAEPLLLHGIAGAVERVAELIERVGLGAAGVGPERWPHELSGGQRQRVAIAIALAARPRLVIADEATSALDAVAAAQVLDLLVGLTRAEGTALVLVTHDLAVARRAERIAVMEAGRIVEHGAAEDVIARPRSGAARALARPAPPLPARSPVRGAPVLAAEGIAVRRGAMVVRGGLSVRPGERLAIVGGSGAGKTTLVRAVLGLVPRAGAVTVEGVPVTRPDDPRLRRAAAMVFQDPATSFDPRFCARAIVAEALHGRGMSRAERRRRAEATLARVGIDGALDRPPHAFSGGQRQRIALARALVAAPLVLFADEAVSALDAALRADMVALIDGLARAEGMAVVFIAHDLAVVRALADRVAVMAHGAVVEEGDVGAIFARPAHPATQALVAAAP